MTKRHWRELVEIVGVVSIVAALLLVAAEIRQSNRIAAAQAERQLANAYRTLYRERATNPEFAKLFPKLEAPEGHLTTATETSQIRGIAWHFINVLWSVQGTYENGLISRETRDEYIVDLAYSIEHWPGIRSHYVFIYENLESIQNVDIYAPITDYIAALPASDEP
jgi:hypothetical protein